MNFNINKKLAQEIVDAVSAVVDKDINFIDKNGIIIGSTDEERIGTFHEAGYKAIKKCTNVTVDNFEQYKGSKKGINYPIMINKIPIGVIGITGEPTEVSKLGFLVTKITEIFIKEQQLNYKFELDKQRIHYVIKSLIYNNIEDKNNIDEILNEFDISTEEEMSVVIIKINNKKIIYNLEVIENDIKQFLRNVGVVLNIYIYPNEIIALVNKKQYKIIKNTYSKSLLKYEEILSGGVGRLHNIHDAHKSYDEAKMALKYSCKEKEIISYIENLDLEIILGNLDIDLKKYYIEKVLSKLDKQDISTLKVYYKNNMSLKLTAEELYIHKNTLQYKLERIYEKCGYNPRVFKDSVILYTAILLI